MPDVRRLVVPGRYENIPTITMFVGEAAQASGLDDTAMFHCQMAVDEACTNVIEHAYGGEDRGDIEVACFVEPGQCRIEVIDHGEAFNPADVAEPVVSADVNEMHAGGIGLHLMRQLMDEIHFTFGKDSNVLVMVKAGTQKVPAASTDDIPVSFPSDGLAVLEPAGHLNSAAAPRLEIALKSLLDSGVAWVIVDMSALTYISSRGLKALVAAWRRAREAGGDVGLCEMMPTVYEVFDTIGFTQIFEIFDTRGEGIAAFDARRGR